MPTRRRSRPKTSPPASSGVTRDPKESPAYVVESRSGWHVYDGRDAACFVFPMSYDSCRLRGNTAVLCRRRPVTIEVTEFCWVPADRVFVMHRRYTDESPALGDGW